MEVGAIVGAFILFFIIVPTLFPKTYKKLHEKVTAWSEADQAKMDAKDTPRGHSLTNLEGAQQRVENQSPLRTSADATERAGRTN